ncbi:MAG: M14 family zinc carboxypeptidase, partial [Xanthomonadales bacterium]|nr:M14 family zinc carboxypeptidase [Xanthomonadales bacterium]
MKAVVRTLIAATLLAAPLAHAQQRIVEWSGTSVVDPNDDLLSLGYPVPIPVETPLPFDGFRTYSGLHMRHQDLASSSGIVHPEVVGMTHAGRTIWSYRLGDFDLVTPTGLPEPAMLVQGGIHAREWQSPEVVTGIMELLVEQHGDQHLYDYLIDHVNMVVTPVLNVDGFLQTQRYPSENWLGTDPGFPDGSPRDGRMRRKNMRDVDEVLITQDDHLFGIDLNRNNPPFWSTS